MRNRSEDIKNAFLVILAAKSLGDITMSEVAQVANVSRSTLYSYFPNTRDIFESCVRDFCKELSPLNAQLKCSTCQLGAKNNTQDMQSEKPDTSHAQKTDHLSPDDAESADFHKKPFCMALRESGKYSSLVRDPNFLFTLLDFYETDFIDTDGTNSLYDGFDKDEKNALVRFQMSGCYSAAMSIKKGSDYTSFQRLIDVFIKGGFRSAKH